MLSSAEAPYQRIALVKVGPGYDQDHQPSMISHRARA
jgi:hypothetical protein